MKILHINTYYARLGGTEAYLLRLLSALEEHGHANVVVCEAATEPSNGRTVYEVGDLNSFSLRPRSEPARAVAEILGAERPDVIHLHNCWNAAVSHACGAFGPTVRTVHTHGSYCPGEEKYLPALGRQCRKPYGPLCLASGLATHCMSWRPVSMVSSYARTCALLKSDGVLPAVIAASRYVRDRLVENGLEHRTVHVLPYFVDVQASCEKSSGDNVLLFSGRIVRRKGLETLVRCLRHVRSKCRLVVTGDGPDLHRMRTLVDNLGLSSRVEFVGWVSEESQLEYCRMATVMVVPSLWPEPFGIVGIEAMSLATPVVAFDVGGIPDWLEHGRTGFLVRPYDEQEMADRISYLLENPDEARAMGAIGRERIGQQFDKAHHVASLTGIYEDATARRWTQNQRGSKGASDDED